MFYTYRVWKISHKIWLAAPALLGEMTRLGVAWTVSCLAWKKGNIQEYRASYDYLVYVTLITSAVVSRSLRCVNLDKELNES
jgi:hypothetical protein